jgi:hypothetical protein
MDSILTWIVVADAVSLVGRRIGVDGFAAVGQFKSQKRAFELGSTMINIESLFNSNFTPMDVSKEIVNTRRHCSQNE